jgi:hypothetical protein
MTEASSRSVSTELSLRQMRSSPAWLSPSLLPRKSLQVVFRLMSTCKLQKLRVWPVLPGRRQVLGVMSTGVPWTGLSTPWVPFLIKSTLQQPWWPYFDVTTNKSTSTQKCQTSVGTVANLVTELNGTNVQLFHLRVEGRAFHAHSIGCTQCTTYHSLRLFQSVKDELALDF